MGGSFSTRWNYERTRQSTAGLLSLDVRHMQRTGVFRPGAYATWQWTRENGEPCGTIQTIMNRSGDRLTLDYATQRPGETDWTSRTIHVWLDTTPCHFGGERVWFRCPHCQRRRAVLVSAGGIFSCRSCHDLAYTSTREDAHERSIRRCQALQKRLGGGGYGVPVWEIPQKPPRMHWQTYARLVRELRVELHKQGGMFDEWIAKREALLRRLS